MTAVDLEVGRNIHRLRKSLQRSREDIAGVLKISSQQIKHYETGTHRISASKLVAFANALAVPVETFFCSAATDKIVQASDEYRARRACHAFIDQTVSIKRLTMLSEVLEAFLVDQA